LRYGTEAGLLLKRHAKRILDDVAEAENAVGGLIGTPGGDLQINAPFTFAAGPLAAMLPAFMAQYPQVRVVLTVDNKLTDIQMEKIDLAIRVGSLQEFKLDFPQVSQHRTVAVREPVVLE
jgi:DNA-binding transcriptional LysR family regulator